MNEQRSPRPPAVETSEARAYVLGWMAALGQLEAKGVRLQVSAAEKRLSGPGPALLRNVASEALGDEWLLPPVWVERAQEYLGVLPRGDLGADANPRFAGEGERRAFARGCFDAVGKVRKGALQCVLELGAPRVVEALATWFSLPTHNGMIVLAGNQALDWLGLLYDSGEHYSFHIQKRYRRWAEASPFSSAAIETAGSSIRYQYVRPDARAPFKSRVTDSGYDLTLICIEKQIGMVTLFGTGLVLEPPYGFYLDVVARSSLIKTGYIVANSVGIIDRGYRGEILVPLIKLDPSAPDLPLPARVVQAIPRPITHFALEQVTELSSTARGSGGFGSSG